ncbi:transposase [mine drainage metagenome]|uniref:Transposase n=1 Tax=mine drainage metagenome TaxID=410659 RepID=A0A1J5QQX8_9ZZZZ
MRQLSVELKQLRLDGMAGAWVGFVEQGPSSGADGACWLLEHLLQAEIADRAMRSVNWQMHSAKFPMHRGLAGFDFSVSPVDRKLVDDTRRCCVHGRRAQCRPGRRTGHREHTPGYRDRRRRDNAPWQARALSCGARGALVARQGRVRALGRSAGWPGECGRSDPQRFISDGPLFQRFDFGELIAAGGFVDHSRCLRRRWPLTCAMEHCDMFKGYDGAAP